MKKIISAILVCFVLVGSMLALVSCGGGDIENGTYVATMGSYEQTVKIDGNKFIMVQTEEEDDAVVATLEIVFTYEVKADEADAEKQVLVLTYKELNLETDDDEIKAEFEEEKADIEENYKSEEVTAPVPFEKTEKGFKAAGIEYVKQ